MATSICSMLHDLNKELLRSDIPAFRAGDTVKVHAKIVEGNKERIQIFEGVVLKRHRGSKANATFTVRKVSYNIGVERTFFLHSPRIEKIEVVQRGDVRRARLFYLRPLRGKSARIKSLYEAEDQKASGVESAATTSDRENAGNAKAQQAAPQE